MKFTPQEKELLRCACKFMKENLHNIQNQDLDRIGSTEIVRANREKKYADLETAFAKKLSSKYSREEIDTLMYQDYLTDDDPEDKK